MSADIHKKLVIGALWSGGVLIALALLGILTSREAQVIPLVERERFDAASARAAWDTLRGIAQPESLSPPSLAPWFPATTFSPYLLVVRTDPERGSYLVFGDTYPAESTERVEWGHAAGRVSIYRASLRRPQLVPGSLTAREAFLQARVLLAAAGEWGRYGTAAWGRVAVDSALALARALLASGDLDRMFVGARTERDAMEVVERDTALALGPERAVAAARLKQSLDGYVARIRHLDMLMTAASSSPEICRSLETWVLDGTRPAALRAGAARAIVIGWAFNRSETAWGIAAVRREVLETLKTARLPDSVSVAVSRATIPAAGFFTRIRLASAYRDQRARLFLP